MCDLACIYKELASIEANMASLKAAKDSYLAELEKGFKGQALKEYKKQGKLSGKVSINVGGFKVVCSTQRNVSVDQETLNSICNSNPSVAMQLKTACTCTKTVKINEKQFAELPQEVQSAVAPARSYTYSSPSFKIEQLKPEEMDF